MYIKAKITTAHSILQCILWDVCFPNDGPFHGLIRKCAVLLRVNKPVSQTYETKTYDKIKLL